MKVVLNVSPECNIKCKHCYIPYSGSKSPEDALETVKQLQQQGHGVIIGGGELLLNPDYLKAFQQAGQKYILTNGLLLSRDDSLYRVLKDNEIEEVRFSLHFGVEEYLKSVPEKVVAETIRKTQRKGLKAQVGVTITSGNYQSVDDICSKVNGYGVSYIRFLRFVISGRGENISGQALGDEQVKYFFDQVVDARKKFRDLEITLQGNFGPREGSKGEKLSTENRYCPAGIDLVAVDPSDNVYGCPFLMGSGREIGKLEDGEIIIDGDLMKKNLMNGRRNTCIVNSL